MSFFLVVSCFLSCWLLSTPVTLPPILPHGCPQLVSLSPMAVLDLCKTKMTVPHSQLVSHPSDCPALVSPLAGQPPQQGREGEAEWGGFVNFFLFYVMLRHFHTKLGISRSTSVENLHKSGFKVSPKLFPLHLMLKTPKVGPMIHEISQVAPRGPDFLVPALQAFHLLQILLLGSAICSASKSFHPFAPVTSVACFDTI